MKVTIIVDDMLIKQVKNQVGILKSIKDKYPDLILSPADKVLFLVYNEIKDVAEILPKENEHAPITRKRGKRP